MSHRNRDIYFESESKLTFNVESEVSRHRRTGLCVAGAALVAARVREICISNNELLAEAGVVVLVCQRLVFQAGPLDRRRRTDEHKIALHVVNSLNHIIESITVIKLGMVL